MSTQGGELDAIARYRRVLTLLPRTYREERGEEMLGVMLDAAEDSGRDRPTLGEVLSVLGLSLRLRTGVPGASARSQSVGEALRLTTLLGLLLQAAAFAENLAIGVSRVKIDYGPLAGLGGITPGPSGIVILSFLCPFLAMVALLRGRFRLGVLLAANPVVLVTEAPRFAATAFGPLTGSSYVFAPLALCLVPAVAGLLGFHRGTPRVPRPHRWLLAIILTSAVFAELDYANDVPLPGAAWSVGSNAAAVGCACIAIGLALTRARHGAVWPTALMLAGAPLLCSLPFSVLSMSDSGAGSLPFMLSNPGSMYIYIGFYALAAEVLLALILAAALLFRRAGVPRATRS